MAKTSHNERSYVRLAFAKDPDSDFLPEGFTVKFSKQPDKLEAIAEIVRKELAQVGKGYLARFQLAVRETISNAAQILPQHITVIRIVTHRIRTEISATHKRVNRNIHALRDYSYLRNRSADNGVYQSPSED